MAAFERGAGCCIHTHSQWAVLVTLLVERDTRGIRISLVLGDTVHPGTHRYSSTSNAVAAIKEMAASPTIHDMRKSA